ncbi:HAD-IA family hydrolase [Zooshikella marina]|uniref:HAD-IA family hydrolase n=1 Tax=Zooshikella ganghwensis TaxID=202772 RepID=UPI001BAF109E|nr:HAD-IA family hydrolase [Zooshikella ganghwensis]MBU2704975.1 HAD-IA family hydrolase [Zooshikella ganghwensis]
MQLKYEYFLFDLDGTLIDTTRIVEKVWEKWCQNVDINYHHIKECCHGVRGKDIIRQFFPEADVYKELKWLEDKEIELSPLANEIFGAKHFLLSLPPMNWGIVTSSTNKVAISKLKACNLPIPRLLISSEDCKRGKPHPEPYLNALKILNIHPSNCLVFEDSDAGIESAYNAGCKVIKVNGNNIHKSRSLISIQDYSFINNNMG